MNAQLGHCLIEWRSHEVAIWTPPANVNDMSATDGRVRRTGENAGTPRNRRCRVQEAGYNERQQ
jgi:hypothetical protein